jgi:putative PIN family toxin of toxin-antitoxin system
LRVVVDTVVFVRALMNTRSASGVLLERASEFTILTTDELRRELVQVVSRPELRRRLTRMTNLPPVDRVIAYLSSAAVVPDHAPVKVCRDPKDDKFFACAAAGNAEYIISEDEDVLAIAEYEGVRTIRVAAFLEFLDASR